LAVRMCESNLALQCAERTGGRYVPDNPFGKSFRSEIVLDSKMFTVLASALNKYVIGNGEGSLPLPLIGFERFASTTGQDLVSLPLEWEL